MTAEDSSAAALFADLWDLVEGWSSGAIQRARQAGAAGPSDVEDAEIRLLIAHAAELRGVIEEHLAAVEADGPASGPDPDPVAETLPTPDPESRPAEARPPTPALTTVPEHACNSADFERPACTACGCLHWFCSICGAQQDVCTAVPIAVTPTA